MDYYNNKWQKRLIIDNFELVGYSSGGFKTGLVILPLKICLDAGVSTQYEPNLILITHGHNDHVGELYNILIGNSRKLKVPIVATPNLIKFIGNFLNSNMSMNCGFNSKYFKWEPIGLVNKHRFIIQDKNIEIQSYKMDHSVECIGYGILEIRDKIKAEFINKTTKEIIDIKKTYKITEEKEFPLFLFCGDTGNSILNNLPFDKYPVVIIESSFFHIDHIKESIEKKHIHISDLEPYFIKYKETKFILIHFSCKYTIEEIKQYQKEYQEKYSNVIFFI